MDSTFYKIAIHCVIDDEDYNHKLYKMRQLARINNFQTTPCDTSLHYSYSIRRDNNKYLMDTIDCKQHDEIR